MLRVDAAEHLGGGDLGGMASRLRGSKIATVAEDGEEISLGGVVELGA